jgi:hypothetical protein
MALSFLMQGDHRVILQRTACMLVNTDQCSLECRSIPIQYLDPECSTMVPGVHWDCDSSWPRLGRAVPHSHVDGGIVNPIVDMARRSQSR